MQGSQKRGRILALCILLFELAVMFAYGFGSSSFYSTDNPTLIDTQINVQTMLSILTLLGFGLILSSCRDSMLGGFVSTLLAVAVTLQLAPIWLKIWYLALIGDEESTGLQGALAGKQLKLSLILIRVSMVLLCGLLLGFTTFIGKIGLLEIFGCSIVFNIGWTLTFILALSLDKQKVTPLTKVFDDYGTNYIYLFAACFSIVPALALSKKGVNKNASITKRSAYYILMGVGFIFATFPFTGILYPDFERGGTTPNSSRLALGPLNLYFCMAASMITASMTGIIGDKLSLKDSLIGSLAGGICLSSAAGFIPNIGACICIGGSSGFLTGLWLKKVHPFINTVIKIDELGFIGPVFLNSILGGLVVSPVTLTILKHLGLNSTALPLPITSQAINYEVAFVGIFSLGGIITGLLSLIFTLGCYSEQQLNFGNKMISINFGLYDDPKQPSIADHDSAIRQARALQMPVSTALQLAPHTQTSLMPRTHTFL